jgi:hypothetical protein
VAALVMAHSTAARARVAITRMWLRYNMHRK